MKKEIEKVFIAYGENQSLENFIGIQLKQYNFDNVIEGLCLNFGKNKNKERQNDNRK